MSQQEEYPESIVPGMQPVQRSWRRRISRKDRRWDWAAELKATQQASSIEAVKGLNDRFTELGLSDNGPLFFRVPALYENRLLMVQRLPAAKRRAAQPILRAVYCTEANSFVGGTFEWLSREYVGSMATGASVLVDGRCQLTKGFKSTDVPIDMPPVLTRSKQGWHPFTNPDRPDPQPPKDVSFEALQASSAATEAMTQWLGHFTFEHTVE